MTTKQITEERYESEKKSWEHQRKNLENTIGGLKAGIIWLILAIIAVGFIAYNQGYKKAIDPKESFIRSCVDKGDSKSTCESKYYSAQKQIEDM